MPKFFTVEQANEALKVIRPLMDEVMSIRQRVLQYQPEIWAVVERSAGNGGSPVLSRMVPEFERFDVLIHQIQNAGAQIKDINIGLLDFSALRNGEEVCLCWKHGEGEIAFWHGLEDGFAGRQPIDSL